MPKMLTDQQEQKMRRASSFDSYESLLNEINCRIKSSTRKNTGTTKSDHDSDSDSNEEEDEDDLGWEFNVCMIYQISFENNNKFRRTRVSKRRKSSLSVQI